MQGRTIVSTSDHLDFNLNIWELDGRISVYRAVDPTGQSLDFLLNEARSTRAAKHFFCKVLDRPNITPPRVINVDKNRSYIGTVNELKQEKLLPEECERRPSQYMNKGVSLKLLTATRLKPRCDMPEFVKP